MLLFLEIVNRQAATTGSFAKLGASLRAHPENLLSILENIEDIVFHQRKAFSYVRWQ